MPDQFSPEFKNYNFDEEVTHLQGEVEKHRQSPESRDLSNQELLKKALQSVTPPVAKNDDKKGSNSGMSDYAESAPPGAKLEVEHLIGTALNEGIMKAVARASQSSPFVLDAFHDALSGKLYDEFKRRGIFK